jgi:hypothetical protein
MANRVGRPTKYNEKILEDSWYYLENYKLIGDEIPMLCGLGQYLGIHKDTIQVWAKEEGKEEFSLLVGLIKQAQESRLINGGLKGELNATITKLVLARHGYTDKQELTGADGGPVLPTEYVVTFK